MTVSFTSLRSRARYEVRKSFDTMLVSKFGGLSGTYCGIAEYRTLESVLDFVNSLGNTKPDGSDLLNQLTFRV